MNNPDAADFEAYRPLMFSIAYRMLGSATEAEDIVQEAYLRYQATPAGQVRSHKALLSTVVTRLCLDHLELARVRRETYLGPWLPEPVLTEADERFAPEHQAELHSSLSIAFLTLLEDLSPLERAVFLLREVFDYEYAEVANAIGREEDACRQLYSRAKRHIVEHRPRFKPDPATHRQLLDQFIQITNTGDMNGLMQLLSDEVVLWTDGGGKTRGAALFPVHGREAVAQFVLASPRLAGNYHTNVAVVNDEPAMLICVGSTVLAVLSLVVDEGRITEIRVLGNPEKLKWVNGNNENKEQQS